MGNSSVMQRPMIVYWSWVFLALALIAGVMGLSGLAGTATALSYVVFLLFFVAYLISFVVGKTTPHRVRSTDSCPSSSPRLRPPSCQD
ncbi:MAG: DUF1328 domain-containing protein [Nitrospira sp.]